MILELRNIWFTREGEHILRDINLSIGEGKVVVVRGRSGVGKTTLAMIAALLLKPTRGKVLFLGNDVTGLRDYEVSRLRLRYIGYIDQYNRLLPNLTVIDNVSLPLRLMGYGKQEAENIALSILKQLDIYDVRDKYPGQISGGQKQRAAIARALVKKPRLIVADEPFSNLDDETTSMVLGLLRDYVKNNRACTLITTTDLYTRYTCSQDYILKNAVLVKR